MSDKTKLEPMKFLFTRRACKSAVDLGLHGAARNAVEAADAHANAVLDRLEAAGRAAADAFNEAEASGFAAAKVATFCRAWRVVDAARTTLLDDLRTERWNRSVFPAEIRLGRHPSQYTREAHDALADRVSTLRSAGVCIPVKPYGVLDPTLWDELAEMGA